MKRTFSKLFNKSTIENSPEADSKIKQLFEKSATLPSKTKEKISSHIREKAIKRAKERIESVGKETDEFTPEELETIVHDEEQRIYSEIKTLGLKAALAALGVDLVLDLLTL